MFYIISLFLVPKYRLYISLSPFYSEVLNYLIFLVDYRILLHMSLKKDSSSVLLLLFRFRRAPAFANLLSVFATEFFDMANRCYAIGSYTQKKKNIEILQILSRMFTC